MTILGKYCHILEETSRKESLPFGTVYRGQRSKVRGHGSADVNTERDATATDERHLLLPFPFYVQVL